MSDTIEVDIRKLWEDALAETGRSFQTASADVAKYAAERAAVLAQAVREPGFEEAVRAERNALLHKLEIEAIDEADATDARLIGLLQGTLAFGARLLAPPA